ncbi:hypothetical protein D6745_04895, partial [Candidatus Woesearchaeota archaeon]
LIPPIKETLQYSEKKYRITVRKACFACAGPSDRDVIKLTNSTWEVNRKEILRSTPLRKVLLLNDFEAVGYGINTLEKKDLLVVNKGKPALRRTKAVIGAGTGLGKSILVYNAEKNLHIPIPCEGGHTTFAPTKKEELEIALFIKRNRKKKQVVYEDLVSGRGIENIYKYLSAKKKSKHSKYILRADDKAALISKHQFKDALCKKTFALFSRFYARCAKNFALDTLSLSGLYIAGGIAAKNKHIFKSEEFKREFFLNDAYENILRRIPVIVIKNYDVSLCGACFAAMINV